MLARPVHGDVGVAVAVEVGDSGTLAGVASAVMKAVYAVEALEAITGTLTVQFCLVLVTSFTPPVRSVLRGPNAIVDVDDFFVTMSL